MLMTQQKKRAREARANIGGWDSSSKSLLENIPTTEFAGYTEGSVQQPPPGDFATAGPWHIS